MEHFRNKFYIGRFVRIFFTEFHHKFKSPVFKWRLLRPKERNLLKLLTIFWKISSSFLKFCDFKLFLQITYPKIIACQTIMLSSVGAPETPVGGSSWSFLKSRINRRRAGVDIFLFSFLFGRKDSWIVFVYWDYRNDEFFRRFFLKFFHEKINLANFSSWLTFITRYSFGAKQNKNNTSHRLVTNYVSTMMLKIV